MIFTRSKAGIKNYPKFYGKSLVIYIEGKQTSETKTRDEIYYEALIKEVLGHDSFRVKTIGNKFDVLDYWEKLRSEKSTDGIAIVDKDLDGIGSSIFNAKNLIYTHGYSWENDFWSSELLEKIIEDLTISNSSARTEITYRKKLLEKRLSKIAALDIGGQLNQVALIKKNGKSCGIGFDEREPSLVPKSEYNRILLQLRASGFNTCTMTKALVYKALKTNPSKIIQGHLWENACIHLICTVYKKYTGAKAAPHEIIINLATSKIKQNPKECISNTVKSHFKQSISLALQ